MATIALGKSNFHEIGSFFFVPTTYNNQSTPRTQPTRFPIDSFLLIPHLHLLRLAAVVVEHLVQRREHPQGLLLGQPERMVIHGKSRRAQPVVTDALLTADTLAPAAH